MISLVVTLLIIGVLLWLFNAYVPCDGKIKNVINVVVMICVIFYLLNAFGVLPMHNDVPVPQLRR